MQTSGPPRSDEPLRRLAPRSAASPVESASGSLAELRSVLDAVPEAVLVFDAEGRVRFANPAVDRMFQGRAIVDHRDLMSRFEPLPAGAPTEGTLLVRPTRTPNLWYELRSVPLGRSGQNQGQGRILVPAYLREAAGLEGDSVVVGSRDHAEIWAPNRWDRYRRELDNPQSLAKALEGLGI